MGSLPCYDSVVRLQKDLDRPALVRLSVNNWKMVGFAILC